MIIVSITGPTMRHALAQIHSSVRFADMFELRLDMIEDPDMARLMASARKPIVATCRPKRQGGGFVGREEDRLGVLLLASSLGAPFLDIEFDVHTESLRSFLTGRSKIILSLHLRTVPQVSLRRIYTSMHRTGAQVLKLAYAVTDASEISCAMQFLEYASRDKRKAIAIATGEAGEATRVLYRKLGGWATYAAPESGRKAAEGQLTGSVLRRVYRADQLQRSTKVFGVIGNPLRQSRGVYIHNPLFQKARRNAVYCVFPVKNLEHFMRRLAPALEGFSVTLPHKERVLRFLDDVDDGARQIGAVNTVLNSHGRFLGVNTDAPGALDAIEQVCRVQDKVMLILGAGGAARAIAYEARRRGSRVIVANRTQRRAERLAQDLHVECVTMDRLDQTPFGIFVNATPVGMIPSHDRSPVSGMSWKGKIVFDVVYNPPMTKLLREARRSGATIISGETMYVNQAALQSSLYTGTMPRLAEVRRLLHAAGKQS